MKLFIKLALQFVSKTNMYNHSMDKLFKTKMRLLAEIGPNETVFVRNSKAKTLHVVEVSTDYAESHVLTLFFWVIRVSGRLQY